MAIDRDYIIHGQSLKCLDFSRATAVPALTSLSGLGIPADCEIKVPVTLYEEWLAATNWVNYADYITYVGVPFWVNVSTSGGTVSPSGRVMAPPGSTRVFKIVPDGTNTLSSVTLDGTSVVGDAVYVDMSANSWACEAVDGATYGFALNANGYYESQNKGIKSSAAVCRIAITVSAETEMSFDIINYGQPGHDYGLIGAVDQVLTTTSTADSNVAWSGYNYENSSETVVNVPCTVPAGTHYVYFKYRKDSSVNRYNDSLQFKVNLPTKSYWTYTMENVQADHDLTITCGKQGVL